MRFELNSNKRFKIIVVLSASDHLKIFFYFFISSKVKILDNENPSFIQCRYFSFFNVIVFIVVIDKNASNDF